MRRTLNITIAQIDPTVGDVEGNADSILAARDGAEELGADLVVCGELALSGYPPEDLVLKGAFQRAITEAIHRIAAATSTAGPAVLLGAPWVENGQLHNSALLLDGGLVVGAVHKRDLPNYGVFDEKRVFVPGPPPAPIDFRGLKLGVMICEDMWSEDAAAALAAGGAEILLVLNGSPFEIAKTRRRFSLAEARVAATSLPLAYVNLVGGQDELVFDGDSFVLGRDGQTRVRLPCWEESLVPTRWTRDQRGWDCDAGRVMPETGLVETIYGALVLGLRDYVGKNRFPGVLIGLSGGIDSALSAAIAVDAIGADRVHCVMMPSRHTSKESIEDAAEVARLCGLNLQTIAIEPAVSAFSAMLAQAFDQCRQDTTEENIQARARGLTLMALSNKFGHMVLSTGNKSEMSVGYATLYGDMCGGFNVLKDVYKTTVFRLSRWRNAHRPKGGLGPDGLVMPERVITKPPSAELRPDQKDQDSLPPYDQLDDILECLIEGELSRAEIAARGHAAEMVAEVWRMVDRAEYKRRQAPPGVKISSRSFGRDRRYPITNGFSG